MQHYPKEMLDEIERLAKEYDISFREAEKYYLMGDLEQVTEILNIQKEHDFKLSIFQIQCILYDEAKQNKLEKMNQILKANNINKKNKLIHIFKKLMNIWNNVKYSYYRAMMDSMVSDESKEYKKYKDKMDRLKKGD